MKIITKVSRSHLTKRQRSKWSETELAREHGGRRQPASGALPVAGLKGDVITNQFLFDDKTTGAKSFSVTDATMQKLARDAFQARRLPVMRVRFEATNHSVYVVDEQVFKRLTHAYLESL